MAKDKEKILEFSAKDKTYHNPPAIKIICKPKPKNAEAKMIIILVNLMLSRSGRLYSVKNTNKNTKIIPIITSITPHASIGSRLMKKFLMLVPNFSNAF